MRAWDPQAIRPIHTKIAGQPLAGSSALRPRRVRRARVAYSLHSAHQTRVRWGVPWTFLDDGAKRGRAPDPDTHCRTHQ